LDGCGVATGQGSDAARRFLVALATGDIAAALDAVAPDVVMVSDGGAHVHAARRAVRGAANVVRLNATLARRRPDDNPIEPALLNGEPGIIVRWPDGRARLAMVFAVAGDRIVRIRSVVNPDKLAAIDRPLPIA
jgi:ketosteroid isomerase-like protein